MVPKIMIAIIIVAQCLPCCIEWVVLLRISPTITERGLDIYKDSCSVRRSETLVCAEKVKPVFTF
jgi:hypothetical protein